MLLYLCTWFDFKLDHLFSMRVIILLSLWGRAQAVSQEIKKWRPASLIEKVSHVSGRLLCFHLDRY